MVAGKLKNEIDIEQRRGNSEQMDVIEYKHLCHRQHGKPKQTSKKIYIHSVYS